MPAGSSSSAVDEGRAVGQDRAGLRRAIGPPGLAAFLAFGIAFATAVVLAGCESGTATVRGVVVAVDAPTATDVRGFTLRTNDGTLLTFRVGRLELVGDAFPAAHLREHLRTLVPIVVVYRVEDGERIAVRLADAPTSGP